MGYEDKIKLCQGIDPYCLNQKDLSVDPTDCPQVTYFHLVNYLIYDKSPYTLESFKAHKSLDAFKFFEAGWLQQVWLKKVPSILSTIVIGKVRSISIFFYKKYNCGLFKNRFTTLNG